MAELSNKISLSSTELINFEKLYWKSDTYRGMRYGQAFHTHFRLNEMTSCKTIMDSIYNYQEKDSVKALIYTVFEFS